MVTYVYEGDIFNLNGISNFAHGCNCAGAMGKGIALQFKTTFPKMYKEYKTLCQKKLFLLGDIFIFKYESGIIFNLGTQINWKTKADIKAIEIALEKMMEYSDLNEINKIALPKIGAGLGGLNWNEIMLVIEKVSKKYPKTDLFVVENYSKN